jgi:hypothetical protein
VTILNSLPIVSALNIENAGNLYTDDDLVANWTFSDADGDSQAAFYILWYKNGIIQPLLNDSMIVTAGNTSKDQSWKFYLIVNDGTTNSSVDWIVAPSSSSIPILNTIPEANGLIITTTPYTTDNLAADWNYTDADNDIQSSYLIRWYKNGVLQPSLNDSMTVSSSLTSKGETWNYTLQVSDGDDYSIVYNSTSVTILNSIPTASGLTITTNPYNTTNLVAGWTFADNDTGDSQVDYIIYWYRDGALQSHLDNKTNVEADNTTKGEVWNFTLFVYDDESWSVAYYSASTTILNSIPSATGLNIENAGNLYTDSNLVANWTFSDANADSQVEFYIWWYKNGILQPFLNNSKIVNAGNTTKDQAWKFELIVYDGEDNSSLVPLASPVTILNTLPGASGLTITTTPYTIDDLDADWLFNDGDSEDIEVSYLVRWYKDGILQPSLNDSKTVLASLTSKGEEWNYTLQVSDGDDYSIVYNSTSVTILNSIPTASGLTITTTPYNTTNLEASWTFADNDTGDSQVDYIIYWYRDGVLQSHLDNKTTVEAGNTTKGEAWNYTLLVYDDESWSVAYNSSSTTILNSIPTTTGLNIENSGNLRTTDDLVANWTFSDVDAESQVEFYIWWYKNGIIQPSLNNSKIVNSGNTTKDQSWKFDLVVYDGEENSTLYTLSSPVQILNTAPEATGVLITSNPNTTTQLAASWTFDDADAGDVEISHLIRWYKGGVLQPSLNDSITVTSSLTTKGEEWNFTLQVYDGEDYSIVYNSPSVTILNSPPIISILTITSNPYNTSDLEASWTFTDDDASDSQVDYLVQWYKDGAYQPLLDNKTIVEAANTTKGEVWNYTLQVFDGSAWSITYNSTITTILNSAPTVVGTPTFNKTVGVTESDTLEIVYTYSDSDNYGEISPIVYWYKNNGTGSYYMSAKDNDTILYSFETNNADFWYYIIRVFDSSDYSGNYTSIGISIDASGNNPPVASDLTITSNNSTIDDLVASYIYFDADNHQEAGSIVIWYWFNSTAGDWELQHDYNGTKTLSSSATSKGDQWKFGVKPKDGLDFGNWVNSSVVTIINSLPTTSDFSITASPYNTTDLVASWTFADDDPGDSQITYELLWYRTGQLQSHLDNKTTVETGNTTKGEEWNYTLRVFDGETYSIYYNSTIVTILNSLPTATGYVIENAGSLRTTDNLVANWTFNDLDLDSQSNYRIRWFKYGELQADLNDTIAIEAGNITKGELWKFTLQVYDDEAWSTNYTSSTVTILNTAPEASDVDLTSTPYTTDDLMATWNFTDVDLSDSQVSYLIRWYKGGILQSLLNDSIIISASLTSKGEEWNYTLQVFDGSDYSIVYNSSIITILNSLPDTSGLTITLTPYNTTNLMASWIFSDDDAGDNQDSYEIRWYRNGQLQSHLNDKITVEASNTTKGEEWNYTLRVNDGEAYSIYYNSTTETILNSAPTVIGFAIENAGNLYTIDNLIANWTFNDLDLDSQSNYNISWFKNGELQENLNDTITVGSGNTTEGESWKFTLQVNDGEDWSITYTSQATTILNTAPEVSNVDLTSNPFTIDDLIATWDYNDDDNDSQSSWFIRWYKEGVLQASLNDSTTIAASLTAKGEEWNYTLQVFDGSDYSTVYNSPIVTILNSLPAASGLTITSNPYNTTNLMASWIFGDDDAGDNQNSYEIGWYRNGVLQSHLNDKITVDASNTTKGEEWNYTLRVHDGEAYSIYYNSTTVTILNTVPTVTGINIENAGSLRTTDNLVGSWTMIDLDLDNQDNYLVRWYKNGELQGTLDDTLTVGSGNTTKGEFWKFTVQVFDGETWSSIYTSQTVSILNSAPTISNFNFSPVDPKTDNDLSISYDFNDDDNGDLEFGTIIRWYRNNVLQSTYNDLVIVDKVLIVKDDIWNVSIKVSDGNNYSTWLNNSITISNTAPTVVDFTTMIYIPVGGLTNTSTLVANWEEQDADGDTITDQFIRWYYYDNETDITPSLVSSLSNCTVVQPGNTTKHQKWYFEILLFDGEDWSSSWKSAILITIGNSEPLVDNIVLTGGVTTTDDIILTYSFYDADGDIESTEIEWTIIHSGNPTFETVTVTGNATNPIKGTATLSSSFITAGDLIWVVITPDDNDGAIDINGQVNSATLPGSNVRVLVGDTPPLITGPPTILADHPNGTTIYSSINSIYVNYTDLVVDIDAGESALVYDVNEELNDDVQHANVSRITGAGYRWYKYNDSSGEWELQEGLTSSFIDPYYLHRDDQWMASVRPRDTYGYYGAWVNSIPVTIGNSLPRITDITWNTENPQTGEDLEVSYVYDDYDGDPEGLSKIQWFVNNGTHTIEITSNENMTILTRDNYEKGDVIFTIIIPHDGDGYGFQFNSTGFTGLITVINTAPEVISSKINDHLNTTYTTDDLVLSWMYNDADGDPEINQSVIIHWYISGEYHPEHDNMSVIPSAETAKGQNWQARIRVFDSYEYSSEILSTILYINNTKMVINWVEINNNASNAYAGDGLTVEKGITDSDGDTDIDEIVYWYVNSVYRSELDNETFFGPLTFLKGDVIYCIYLVYDGDMWSDNKTSQTITIMNTKPIISGYWFVYEHGLDVVTPLNSTREFFVQDEAIGIDYKYNDDDVNDNDYSAIIWYRDGELQSDYNNSKTIPASVTTPGEIWQVFIIPHDGFETGNMILSINITIESRPIIHDNDIEPLPRNEGTYDFWTETSVVNNTITQVEYLITINALNYTREPEIVTRTNGTEDLWVLNDFSIIDLLEDPAEFATLIGTNVTVNVTVITTVTYSGVDYLIKTYLSYTFTIEDNAPPRVEIAGFSWNDDQQPTNVTFYALVQEYGSGIDSITLLYYLKAVSGENATNGASSYYRTKTYQDTSNLSDFNSTEMTFNGTHYVATVDYTPIQNTEVYFTVRVADQSGNVNGNAYPDGIDLQNVRDKIFKYIVPFDIMTLLPYIVVFVAIVAILAFVAIKKFSGTELVGLDIDKVMDNIQLISEEEIAIAIDQHSLGVIVSFFDQKHGPIPIIVEPTILRDNFAKMVELSDRSFSAGRFMEDFNDEEPYNFDFRYGPGLSTRSVSWSYALERPDARGGAENITLNILVHKIYSELVVQFINRFSEIVHDIHIIMDKNPEKKDDVINKISDLRRFVTSIILSYESMYGPVEEEEEELEKI